MFDLIKKAQKKTPYISCIRLTEDKHTGTWRQRCLKKQNKKFLCNLERNKWYGKRSTKPDWKAPWGIASVFAVASVKPTLLRGQIIPHARQVNKHTTENVNYDNTDANNDNNKIHVKQVTKPMANQNIKWHSVQNLANLLLPWWHLEERWAIDFWKKKQKKSEKFKNSGCTVAINQRRFNCMIRLYHQIVKTECQTFNERN